MILVPDEATSAEHHAIKVAVQRAIRAWLPNCTMSVVAHRMSAMILETGTGVEAGSPTSWEEVC